MTNIPYGTPIISESELFSILEDQKVSRDQGRIEEFKALSCPHPNTIAMRFAANSWAMGKDHQGNEIQGIFKLSARLNHSCLPNAYVAWNSSSRRLTVHAITTISTGEEIFVNYRQGDSFKTRDERRQAISTDYKFDCTCKACDQNTDFGRKSEDRRRQMRSLQSAIVLNQSSRLPNLRNQARADIRALGDLLGREGLLYPQQADMYDEEVQWYKIEMKRTAKRTTDDVGYKAWCRQEALQAARKKLDLDIAATGYDSPDVMKTLTLIREVKKE